MQSPHFELFWTDGYLVRRIDNAEHFTPPAAISRLDDSGLSFSVIAPASRIEALHVRVAGVLGTGAEMSISIELRSANTLLASQSCALDQIRRSGRIELDLRGTALVPDGRYDVLIRPVDHRPAERSLRLRVRSRAMKAFRFVDIASIHLARLFSKAARKAYRRSLRSGVLWPPLARAESRWGCGIAIPTARVPADGLPTSQNLVGVRSQAARLDLFASRQRAGRRQAGVVVLPDLKFEAARFLGWLRQHGPDIAWTTMPVADIGAWLPALIEADIVAFVQPPWSRDPNQPLPGCELRAEGLLWSLHLAGVCTMLADGAASGPAPQKPLPQQAQQSALYHFRLAGALDADVRVSALEPGLLPAGNGETPALPLLVARVRERFWPRVAVIVMAEADDTTCLPLLHGLADQSYGGAIDLFLSGPSRCESDVVAKTVRILPTDALERGRAPHWSVASRVQADLYIFLDADGTLDRDFIAAHVEAHWFDAVDVVIGSTYAARPELADAGLAPPASSTGDRGALILPDTAQPDAFINVACGNVSIKRRCLLRADESPRPVDGGLPAFAARIDFGYRLYDRGAKFVFAPDAVVARRAGPFGHTQEPASAGGLNALLHARPEIGRIVGRWLTCQADRLLDETNGKTGEERSDAVALGQATESKRNQAAPLVLACKGARRRLRILSYRWHVAHQYEIYKLPHDFTLVTRLGLELSDSWDFRARPLPDNVRLAKVSTIDPRDFDAAILHFDENVLSPELTNGVVPAAWGAPLRWFLENVDLPKVAICHGTPPFVGQWGANPDAIESFVVYEDVRRRLVAMFQDIEVVVNSWQAQREWGFARSRVIWHGFDPQQFPPATRVRDIISHGADYKRPHYRGRHAFDRVANRLPPDIAISGYDRADVALLPRRSNAYAAARFRAYVDHIRQFKAYLNTTLRSPMPRSRGEAMMCGVIPVSLRNHDVDMFIRSGENGFIADEPEALADFLTFLCRNPAECSRIGAAARDTALATFNHDRFLSTWAGLLHDLAQ